MSIGSFLAMAAAPLARKVLVGLGMGMLTYGAVMTAVSTALDSAATALQGLPAEAAAILAMAGVWHGMGLLAGGLLAGVALRFTARLGVVTGG